MNSVSIKHSLKKKASLKHSTWKILVLSLKRLSPFYLVKNPVMFVTWVGSLLTTLFGVIAYLNESSTDPLFISVIAFWLWFTVLFANFSEALAESRGKAQAETLKRTRQETQAKLLKNLDDKKYELIPATSLKSDDLVLVEARDIIPGDGEVILGVAAIDESAITGESAPVIREKGDDRNSVTGGTLVLSDWLVIRITSDPGETFLDRMISLVEGAKRQRTPNEIALSILLAGMTLIFLIVVMTLKPASFFSLTHLGHGTPINGPILIALLICLIPTTIGGLLSAIGIAGMDRLIRSNVVATSGRAVEAAGDVSVLLLDKTGTITLGNRQAINFFPVDGTTLADLSRAAELSSLLDDTPEGKSIIQLARGKYQLSATDVTKINATFIPFCAETRVSGVIIGEQKILKGAFDKIARSVQAQKGIITEAVIKKVEEIARLGSTPLVVANNNKILGVIELKDIIKAGIKERLAELRSMGIKSIMITGDNPLTAATIANEVGVDDFYAEASPEVKLQVIRNCQANGQLVAMVGDGTNDAPALAQTDVAVAMNTGTQAAKEAANMVDLDSDPTKLIEIVKIGKQLLVTRGALTTFSIANDVAKYFAILPAAFSPIIPELSIFNIMHLASPHSAVLSAIIFNALIIIVLIPLALRGIKYRPMSANKLLLKNCIIFGAGGIIVPFIGIKLIDIILMKIHLF